MHELSLCTELVRILDGEAERQGFARVTEVWLDVGRWSTIEPEAMRLAFDVATRGTLAEGARLRLELVAPRGTCLQCASSATIEGEALRCPRCGSLDVQLDAGEELRVREIEVS